MALRSTPMMRVLAAGIRGNVPTLLWGPPGVGKSAKITAHGRKWGRHVECVVGSVRESSDYLGLPVENDGVVEYSTLSWARRLADAKAGLLFLDELTTAGPSTQKAMLRVLQERWVGEFPLPETVAIVAAANPPEQAADGWDLPAPIANRMLHLDWHFDADEWFAGLEGGFDNLPVASLADLLGDGGTEATKARAFGLIRGFLQARRDLVAPTPPTDEVEAGKAWPSPRSWTNLITVLGELDPTDDEAWLLAAKGCVGETVAKSMFAWLAVADLHNPDDVLADPSIVAWDQERPDRLFALTSSIVALVLSRGDETTWKKGVKALTVCGQNRRPDVALPGVKRLLENMPAKATIPTSTQETFADLFQRTGRWAASGEKVA